MVRVIKADRPCTFL